MICIPITSPSNQQAFKDIAKAEKIADVIELRLDYIKNLDLKVLMRKTKKPVIVTCRKKLEGGHFEGDEKNRVALLKWAIVLNATYVDIELSSGKDTVEDLAEAKRAKKSKTKIIVSYHNFKETPKNLMAIYEKIKKINCDIIKIATHVKSINDNLAIFDLIKKAKKNKRKIIALCMGARGEISRILSPIYGSYLTFGSLGHGKESAPGQIPAEVLKNVYRINKLKNKKPKIYGLVGNPVKKSKGYLVHNLAFAKLNLNNIYVNFLVDDLRPFIKNYRKVFYGLSITMPHKEEIVKFLDKIDPRAKKIGAVNTVVVKNGKLVGYNTDYLGAIQAIEHKTIIRNKKVIILGAGGLAKAIAYGIKSKGGKLMVLNRTVSKAKRLASDLKCDHGDLNQLDKLEFDILINATSAGMFPNISQTLIKNRKILKNKIVLESVYNPINTKFLKDAKIMKSTIISGLDLFINQAAWQFKLWTGREMSLALVKKLLKNKNENRMP